MSFDSALLPDGNYEVKVVASDSPDHTDADALTGERVSEAFVVDTTPPVPGALTAAMVAGTPARFMRRSARRMRPRRSAMRSTAWMRGRGSIWSRWAACRTRWRSGTTLSAAVPAANATGTVTDAREHVLAVRVYDRYENVAAVKTVVR